MRQSIVYTGVALAYCFHALPVSMHSAYHRISAMVSAKQAPAEYMSGGGTHITDHDPESGEYGEARYPRRPDEGLPEELVDNWVSLYNSGVRTLDIANRFNYPFHTVDNEISKHPQGRATALTTVHLTDDLAKRVDKARGKTPRSKFILKLLETGVNTPGYAKAAAVGADRAERWLRMRERGLGNSQIAEAVGAHPRTVTKVIGPQQGAAPSRGGPARTKVSVRMPLWLKNMLAAAAHAAGTNLTKLERALIDSGLALAGV